MSINKNFVVKNGFEASADLILANADTRKVGIGTTTPQYTLHVNGGIGATDFYLTGIGTFVDELNVGLGGTVLTVLGLGNSIGIGTALPAYLLDIRSPVSTGQTALYVQGDVRITGDLSLDDVTLDDAEIQNLTVTEALNVTSPGISTFGGYVDINDSVDISSNLNVVGLSTLGGYVDINANADFSGTINVVGLSTLGGYVDINNSVDISNNLNVVGLTTLGGYVDINDSVDISTDLNVSGIATLATADINAGEIDVTRIETSNLNVTGIATIASVSIVGAALSTLTVSGISTLAIVDINGGDIEVSNVDTVDLNVTGISTLAIVDINGGDIEVSNVDTVDLNVTGISTLGTVRISSGIITATSGIVTYYGDGQYLDLTNNPSTGIGIGTTGGLVGYGITFLDLKGAGVSTTFYNSNTGIATIFFEGGGGGSGTIGIGTEFPLSAENGDLFFSAEYGRLFVYYDENIIGIGTDEFWIDAAPFNVGIITSLTNVSFVPGSASNPSMFFVGDSQTGFFSPTPGQFTVVSTGSSILNINPSGVNVTGIVTATSFIGNGSGLTGISSVSFATTAFNLIGTASTASFATTAFNLIGTASTASFATTSFNLIGTASTASFATTSFGLSGSPAILVSSIGINTTSAPTNLYVSGSSASNIVGLGTTNANTALNFATGNNFSMTLVGSIVLENPTGVTTGQSGVIYIQQDGVGNHTVGFGSHWDFPSATAPTLTLTANALDALTYSVRTSTSIVAAALIGIGTL
jgi:hypothetical protein